MKTLHKRTIVILSVVLLIVAMLFGVGYPKLYISLKGEPDRYTEAHRFRAQLVSAMRYLQVQQLAGCSDASTLLTEEKLREVLKDIVTFDPQDVECCAENDVEQFMSDDEYEAETGEEELPYSTDEEREEYRKEAIKKQKSEVINNSWNDIFWGYQAAGEWISAISSIGYYIKDETTGKSLSNEKDMEQLETKECEKTKFNQYEFLLQVDINGNGTAVKSLRGANTKFANAFAFDQNMGSSSDSGITNYKISSWYNGNAPGIFLFPDNYRIYIGVKDKKDISGYLQSPFDREYQSDMLQYFYITEFLVFLIVLVGSYRSLSNRKVSQEKVILSYELYFVFFIVLSLVLPVILFQAVFDIYSSGKCVAGAAGLCISLYMTAYMSYLIARVKCYGIRKELCEGTLVYHIYKRYRELQENEKTKEQTRVVRKLISKTVILTVLGIIAWYIQNYICRYDSEYQTLAYVVAAVYLIGLWFWFFRTKKKAATKADYTYYQKLLDHAEAIASGQIGITMTEDLGRYNPLRDAINHINEGLSKAVDEAVKSQSMKTELITNVSHDLKTPLTSIVSYVDLLKRRDLTDDEKREYVEILDQKASRLKTLIEDLFEMSKAASRDIKLTKTKLNIVAITREVLVEQEKAMDEKDLKVNMSYISDTIKVNLDGQKTYRIISNLVSNIAKYTMEHTRVYVAITKDERDVMLEFKNVSATELTHQGEELTERFVREDKARSTEGSGLGLAIAKSLTELQQGTFKVEAEGDLFKVRLTFPLAN